MIEIYETPEELEKAAQSAGFSMRLVCARARFAHTTWYRWKNAKTKPTRDVVIRLGQALEDLRNDAAMAPYKEPPEAAQ